MYGQLLGWCKGIIIKLNSLLAARRFSYSKMCFTWPSCSLSQLPGLDFDEAQNYLLQRRANAWQWGEGRRSELPASCVLPVPALLVAIFKLFLPVPATLGYSRTPSSASRRLPSLCTPWFPPPLIHAKRQLSIFRRYTSVVSLYIISSNNSRGGEYFSLEVVP